MAPDALSRKRRSTPSRTSLLGIAPVSSTQFSKCRRALSATRTAQGPGGARAAPRLMASRAARAPPWTVQHAPVRRSAENFSSHWRSSIPGDTMTVVRSKTAPGPRGIEDSSETRVADRRKTSGTRMPLRRLRRRGRQWLESDKSRMTPLFPHCPVRTPNWVFISRDPSMPTPPDSIPMHRLRAHSWADVIAVNILLLLFFVTA